MAVDRYVQCGESITPDRENHEKYGRYFALYREIHDALAPVEKLIHETFVAGEGDRA
jgi:sugar (pentulose or hexulose) kinase